MLAAGGRLAPAQHPLPQGRRTVWYPTG